MGPPPTPRYGQYDGILGRLPSRLQSHVSILAWNAEAVVAF